MLAAAGAALGWCLGALVFDGGGLVQKTEDAERQRECVCSNRLEEIDSRKCEGSLLWLVGLMCVKVEDWESWAGCYYTCTWIG